MSKNLSVLLALGCLLQAAPPLRADFEADLLQKFQQQNKQADQKLKQAIEKSLAQAAQLGATNPEKVLSLLRQSEEMLLENSSLSKTDKAALVSKLKQGIHEARERLKSLEAQAEAQAKSQMQTYPGPAGDPKVSPPFIAAGVTPVPFQAGGQVTPVVLPDRRYVRVGINGGFSFATPGPPIAVPVVVPTVLQGPGNGVRFLRPVVANQVVAPPVFKQIGLDTTVTAPTGGAINAGSFSTFMEGRNEFGAPGLGRISYLGRGFRNTGYGSQGTRMQITVSPQIIILSEQEQRLFGPQR